MGGATYHGRPPNMLRRAWWSGPTWRFLAPYAFRELLDRTPLTRGAGACVALLDFAATLPGESSAHARASAVLEQVAGDLSLGYVSSVLDGYSGRGISWLA